MMPQLSDIVSSLSDVLVQNKTKLIDALALYAAFRCWRIWLRNRSLPPGPTGLPYFGHYLRWYLTILQEFQVHGSLFVSGHVKVITGSGS